MVMGLRTGSGDHKQRARNKITAFRSAGNTRTLRPRPKVILVAMNE